MSKKCIQCGYEIEDSAAFCDECGAAQPQQAPAPQEGASEKNDRRRTTRQREQISSKSHVTAGLLGLFLGMFGLHNFYLGFTKKAIIQLVVSICTFGAGGIWGMIEGILLLIGKMDKDSEGAVLL